MSGPDASQPLLSSAVPALIHASYSSTHPTNPSVFAPSQSASSLTSPPSPPPPPTPLRKFLPHWNSSGKTSDEDFTPHNIRTVNWDRGHYEDIYYWALRFSWKAFVGVLLLILVLLVLAFAAINRAFVGGLTPEAAGFGDLVLLHFLVFSGYGTGPYAVSGVALSVLLSVETLVRTVYFTIVTGLLYARFARPIPRIRFTPCAFLSVHHGHRSLTFRMANDRLEALINTQVQLTMSITQHSTTGNSSWRRFHDLQLVRPSLPTFLLPWTVQHRIDARSPLWGMGEDEWKAGRVEVYVVVSAVDSVFGGSVWARKKYGGEDVRWGYKPRDVFREVQEGGGVVRVVDMALMDEVDREDRGDVEAEKKEQEAPSQPHSSQP